MGGCKGVDATAAEVVGGVALAGGLMGVAEGGGCMGTGATWAGG